MLRWEPALLPFSSFIEARVREQAREASKSPTRLQGPQKTGVLAGIS